MEKVEGKAKKMDNTNKVELEKVKKKKVNVHSLFDEREWKRREENQGKKDYK